MQAITNTDDVIGKELIEAAEKMLTRSYSPYSKFKVGSALLAGNGKVFSGTNVENSSYGLTICAERNAICSAVSNGETQFKAIAVTKEYSMSAHS